MSRQVMVIAAYDSQLKWAMGLANELVARGWAYSVVVPSDIRNALSDAQVAATGSVVPERLPWAAIVKRAGQMDCVVLALHGPLVERFTTELNFLREQSPFDPQPVIVTGWVGIIIENVVAGYMARAAADVIAVNSSDNLRVFVEAGQLLGLPADNLLLSGLPLLPARPASIKEGPIRTVLFADQPTIPVDLPDRAYIYQRLAEYAAKHPERTVLLKPRHRLNEDTLHKVAYPPEKVLGRLPEVPSNLKVVYDPITELLDQVDLMLTVSSTAALEAIGAGVRTVFIQDLGVHEKYGNPVLLESGLLATFDEIEADQFPTPNPAWLSDIFVGDGERTPAQRVAERVVELVALVPAERPGAIVARGRYLSGRIAIWRHRSAMPAIARDPKASTRVLPKVFEGALGLAIAKRGSILLKTVLPPSWYQALRNRR